jgi:hypothetical protein
LEAGFHPKKDELPGAQDANKFPPAGKTVIAQCAGYRCLAIYGEDGKWRSAQNNEELPVVISWEIFGKD